MPLSAQRDPLLHVPYKAARMAVMTELRFADSGESGRHVEGYSHTPHWPG